MESKLVSLRGQLRKKNFVRMTGATTVLIMVQTLRMMMKILMVLGMKALLLIG